MRSRAPCPAAAPTSSAAPVQASVVTPAGTLTGQRSSAAPPAGIATCCAGSVSGPPSVALTVIARAVVLRSVQSASKRSPSRTSVGSPDSICRSCVTRIVAAPLPKRSSCAPPPAATATRRKALSESFSGTSSVARPCASSCTSGRHSSSVSNSSRVGLRPPLPPGASALRP